MGISHREWGETPEGESVRLYTLVNSRGTAAEITNYGGVVASLKVKGGDGEPTDVVLGYDTLGEYVRDGSYMGCVVGRYANRIAGGRLTLNGVEHQLTLNEGGNHLHGGSKGFNKAVWEATEVKSPGMQGVHLSYISPDGDEGYPGRLHAEVTYTLTEMDELRIGYRAEADSDTVVNLSHHSYFNLAGEGTILDHTLQLEADRYTPVDGSLIPTGEIVGVEGTPMNFRGPVAISERIDDGFQQLNLAGGYDHNWVLKRDGEGLAPAARVRHPGSGRTMEVYTTEPGIQFYSGNFLKEGTRGKDGAVYGPRSGLCLEAQHFPDSPNRPGFPSTVLRKGDVYRQTTVYRFDVG